MEIKKMTIKRLKEIEPTLTTDTEKELYNAIYTFLNDIHNPACVYHYTDFSALKGILLGKGFRLCRVDTMNDKKEMKNFIEMVEISLKKRFKGDIATIRKIDEKFKEEKKERENDIAYATSFSAWEDDAAQWDRYGNDGKGVSITVNTAILKNIVKNKKICLQENFYGKDADKHQITDVLEDIFSDSTYVRHGFDKDSMGDVFWQMWILSVAHKQFSFASEREFRLMTWPKYKGKRYDKLGEVCKEMTPTGLRECVYWNWKEDCEQNNITYDKLIEEIVIGPRAKMSVRKLRHWLKENNLDCLAKCVKKSKSSLA